MINVSHDTGQNWNSLIKDAKEIIIKKLNRILNCNIEKKI